MPRYSYKARDEQDRIITGTLIGADEDEIASKLSEKDMVPIAIEELNFDGTKKNQRFLDKLNEGFKTMQNKVPYKDVVFFTRQLATMVEGGVSLSRALTQLAKSEKPIFKKIINQVADDISAGHTFSDAIAKHPGAFNAMYVSVAHTGEMTGALDRVLDELATYMENTEAMRAKVKGAMRYPTFIGGFVLLLMIGIMWKLVPIFEGMYKGMNATLPLPTQILISISHFIQENILGVVIGLIVLFIAFKIAMTKNAFRYYFHMVIIRIPVFGTILKKNIWAMFSRTMSLLMECGIPILQATEVSGGAVNNLVFSAKLKEVHENLKKGELLSASLEKTGIFPVLVSQLVMTGEESGRIDQLLRKAAEFYEREIRVTVDSLSSIIEPFLIIILGGIVGGILIALYLPVFSIGKLMQ